VVPLPPVVPVPIVEPLPDVPLPVVPVPIEPLLLVDPVPIVLPLPDVPLPVVPLPVEPPVVDPLLPVPVEPDVPLPVVPEVPVLPDPVVEVDPFVELPELVVCACALKAATASTIAPIITTFFIRLAFLMSYHLTLTTNTNGWKRGLKMSTISEDTVGVLKFVSEPLDMYARLPDALSHRQTICRQGTSPRKRLSTFTNSAHSPIKSGDFTYGLTGCQE
jgi:hypothetical protein